MEEVEGIQLEESESLELDRFKYLQRLESDEEMRDSNQQSEGKVEELNFESDEINNHTAQADDSEDSDIDSDDSDCVYTDSDGNYCDCNVDKNCVVAQVHFEACGDRSSSLQYLVNKCMHTASAGRGRFRSFKQKCRNGVVTKQWHHSEDCSDNVAHTEFVSDSFKPCVKVVCDDADSPFEAVVDAIESQSGANMPVPIVFFIASFIIVLFY